MDAQQFAYWLQGFAELNAEPPSAAQWQSIREHLATVFEKVTPAYRPGAAFDWAARLSPPAAGDVPPIRAESIC